MTIVAKSWSRPPVLRRVLSRLSRFLAPGAVALASVARSLTTGSAAARSGPAASAASPSEVSAGVPAVANGSSASVAPARLGAATRRSAATGCACSANLRSSTIVGSSSASAGGNSMKPCSMSSRRSAAACPATVALLMKLGDAVLLAGQRREHGVGVDGELRQALVLLGEDRQHAIGLLQRRVGPLDHLAERVATGGEAGAEVVEDQPEAIDLGLAGDVVEQVEVDGLAVVLERQEALPLAGLAVGDHVELWRRLGDRGARLGRRAVDELLAEQRLRPDQAGGVGAEVLEAGVGDLENDRGLARVVAAVRVYDLAGLRDVDRADRAHVGAGDPHLLVLDEEAGVVEVGAHLVVVGRAARRRWRRSPAPRRGRRGRVR